MQSDSVEQPEAQSTYAYLLPTIARRHSYHHLHQPCGTYERISRFAYIITCLFLLFVVMFDNMYINYEYEYNFNNYNNKNNMKIKK